MKLIAKSEKGHGLPEFKEGFFFFKWAKEISDATYSNIPDKENV